MKRHQRFLFAQIEAGRPIQGTYPPVEDTLRRYAQARELLKA